MSLVDRVRNILMTPKTEWPLIAAEPATVHGIYTGYAVPVALLPVVGAILGGLLFGHGVGLVFVLVPAIVGYVVGLALLYVMAMIADALAPSFDGHKGQVSALKLVTYSATAQWVAGFFAFIPGINALLALAGFAYGAYLLYLGATTTMGVPAAKSPGYTAVVIVIWIVLTFVVVGAIVGALVASLFTSPALIGAYGA